MLGLNDVGSIQVSISGLYTLTLTVEFDSDTRLEVFVGNEIRLRGYCNIDWGSYVNPGYM